MSAREELAAALAQHARSDWSDGTFACTGCRQRFERETQAEWESLTTREQRMEYRERLGAHINPDWSLAEYHQHVADALLASPALAQLQARLDAIAAYAGHPGNWGASDTRGRLIHDLATGVIDPTSRDWGDTNLKEQP